MLKTLIVASVLATAAVGSVSAMTVDQLTSSTNVNLSVNNGVATLFGNVDSHFERDQAAKAAAQVEGVDEVRNLLTFN